MIRPNDILERIDLLFASMLGRFVSIPARRPATGDCSMARIRVLMILEHSGSVTPGELASVLGVSSPTATELAQELASAGYVKREPSTRDRRQVILTLRPAGRRVLAQFGRQRREKFRRVLAAVHPSDARRLAGALETVNEVLAKGGS